jgi:hypothetical protein
MIEDFFYLQLVSSTPVVHLELQLSPLILAKNLKWPSRDTQMLEGKLIHKKNLKSKIS